MPWTELEKPDKCPRCGKKRVAVYSTPALPDKVHPICRVCDAETRAARKAAKPTPKPKPAARKAPAAKRSRSTKGAAA